MAWTKMDCLIKGHEADNDNNNNKKKWAWLLNYVLTALRRIPSLFFVFCKLTSNRFNPNLALSFDVHLKVFTKTWERNRARERETRFSMEIRL
ncbi:hypothetical protein CEXT_12601 [Caerostris extrusa]|uniref:Uncharacterized protein n=1 Tax=Caerostris extrusa TaxID=172846 RepID=A0AAV4P9F8_CAEEX|nr:hypothetical protein CEXT_12601 [Caerostris extrusa]